MTYCRIFDTNTLGYSSLFFFSSFSFLSAHLFTSRTQSRQPQWHQGRPWELAWAGERRLLVHIYIGARRSVRTYVCLMGSELVHLQLHRPSLFQQSPLLADMKAKQSNQILIGWNSSGSAGTKNKSLVGWLVGVHGVVRVFCAQEKNLSSSSSSTSSSSSFSISSQSSEPTHPEKP